MTILLFVHHFWHRLLSCHHWAVFTDHLLLAPDLTSPPGQTVSSAGVCRGLGTLPAPAGGDRLCAEFFVWVTVLVGYSESEVLSHGDYRDSTVGRGWNKHHNIAHHYWHPEFNWISWLGRGRAGRWLFINAQNDSLVRQHKSLQKALTANSW